MLGRRALKRMFAVITAIGSLGGLGFMFAGTATAASTQAVIGQTIHHSVTPAVACSYADGVRVRSASWTNGNETRTVYLWYSTSTACVWAVEVHGQPGDEVWVYNKNTGAEAVAYIASGQSSATTGEISDSGTLSHACMLPHLSNGTTGPKTCTTYY
jgi:hypothetical protein